MILQEHFSKRKPKAAPAVADVHVPTTTAAGGIPMPAPVPGMSQANGSLPSTTTPSTDLHDEQFIVDDDEDDDDYVSESLSDLVKACNQNLLNFLRDFRCLSSEVDFEEPDVGRTSSFTKAEFKQYILASIREPHLCWKTLSREWRTDRDISMALAFHRGVSVLREDRSHADSPPHTMVSCPTSRTNLYLGESTDDFDVTFVADRAFVKEFIKRNMAPHERSPNDETKSAPEQTAIHRPTTTSSHCKPMHEGSSNAFKQRIDLTSKQFVVDDDERDYVTKSLRDLVRTCQRKLLANQSDFRCLADPHSMEHNNVGAILFPKAHLTLVQPLDS